MLCAGWLPRDRDQLVSSMGLTLPLRPLQLQVWINKSQPDHPYWFDNATERWPTWENLTGASLAVMVMTAWLAEALSRGLLIDGSTLLPPSAEIRLTTNVSLFSDICRHCNNFITHLAWHWQLRVTIDLYDGRSKSVEPGYLPVHFWAVECYRTWVLYRVLLVSSKNVIYVVCMLVYFVRQI